MRCSQLLACFPEHDPEITHLTQDSRQVRQGSLFFCDKSGELAKKYISDALEKGAAAIVSREKDSDRNIFSPDPRGAYALACQKFWKDPQKELKLIAITGTNGKSSVAWMLQHILQSCGHSCGLIGTICCKAGTMELPSLYTTPDAGQLYPLLRQMADRGCEYVVMEASSQAIAQKRLSGLEFELGIFTNLSRDHLDQHGTMEEYFAVKDSIFEQCKLGLVNYDDSYGLKIREKRNLDSYSLYNKEADVWAKNLITETNGSSFLLDDEIKVHVPIPGDFSASNGLAALGAAKLLDIPLDKAVEALASCPPIPGRAEWINCGDFDAVIDYAHTSDGVEHILKFAAGFGKNRLYVVFGCAGERDRGDRKAMAEAVLRYADKAFYTADNPRGESWKQLCKDVGNDEKLVHIFDREKAISEAFGCCESGDLLLLLGKGHEEYQALAEKTIWFSEKACLEKLINKQ